MGNYIFSINKHKWDQKRRLLEIQLKVRSFSNHSALSATLSELTVLDQSSVEFMVKKPPKLRDLLTLVLSPERVENGTIKLLTSGSSHQLTMLQVMLWHSLEFQMPRTEEILLPTSRKPSED